MTKTIHRTQDGHSWTRATNKHEAGLITEGAIQPQRQLNREVDEYDVIVIGAGYAGLTAARDSALTGLNVLLVEARDRIGGRTWTSVTETGELREMGGTWVHYQQGYVWRELSRYGIAHDLKYTPNADYPDRGYAVSQFEGKEYRCQNEDLCPMFDKALATFCNVDGANGKLVVPWAPGIMNSIHTNHNLVHEIDALSVRDRIEKCRTERLLTERELAFVVPLFLLCSGGTAENSALLESIKWYQHSGATYQGMVDLLMGMKIAKGQSHLARRIFDEAVDSGLSYVFKAPVRSIRDQGTRGVTIETDQGSFRGKKVVSTLPLNVANRVKFEPPLDPLKQEAFGIGHVNKGDKIHVEVADVNYRSWTGNQYRSDKPFSLVNGFGDQVLRNGNSVVVAFGCNAQKDRVPSKDPSSIPTRFAEFDPELESKIVSAVWHEWYADEYAEGNWCMKPPGFLTRFMQALQAPSGNIHWASADWAEGWNSFIDGAIEQGTKAAYQVKELLRESRETASESRETREDRSKGEVGIEARL